MTKGQVVAWNDPKGLGVLLAEDGREVFVSHADLRGDGFKSLREGQWVSFELDLSSGAARARDVAPCEPGTPPPEPERSPDERSARGVFVVFFDVENSREDGWVAVGAATRAEAERLADEKLPSLDMKGMLAPGPHAFALTDSVPLEEYEAHWGALETLPRPGDVLLLEIGS
jgi:CspA family cold shock protein